MERFQAFTVLIAKINRSIHKIKTYEGETLGVKAQHISALFYLYKAGSLTATELCDLCKEDKSAVSRSLEYLESSGYVYCDSDLKKRYKSEFVLTDKGKIVAQGVVNKIDSILEEVGGELSSEERAVMYKCLNLISDNMDNYVKNTEDRNIWLD